MSKTSNQNKRLYYITPENLAELRKRAPITGGNGGGSPNVNLPLNSSLQRYAGMCAAGIARVMSALPDEQDRAFIRRVLSSTFTDDLLVSENPLAYLHEIEEAAAEYVDAGLFTGALIPALRRFGPLEALAIVDWIEQEKLRK